MKALEQLQQAISQAEFALIVGISEAKASQLVSEGVLDKGDTAHEWLKAYFDRLREVAAGRASGELGGLDLVQERAALAREQRVGHEIKNAVARGEYAPINLLAELLAMASQAVVERFEQLPSALKKACPDLPEKARDQVMQVLAAARNEWVSRTEKLVVAKLATPDDEEGDGSP